jgi:hypothetical protein
VDRTQLTAFTDDRPVLPTDERDRTDWTLISGSHDLHDAPAPF